MILERPDIRERRQAGSVEELMEDVDRRSEAAGWGYTPRPAGGFGASPAFDSSADATDALRRGYEEVRPLVWGRFSAFEEAIDTVRRHPDLL